MAVIWNYLFDREYSFFSSNETIFIYTFSFIYSIILAYIFTLIKPSVNNNRKVLYKFFLIICYTIIALPVANVIGCRSTGVGYDTNNYLLSYIKASNIGEKIEFSFFMESSFSLLQRISFILFEGKAIGAIYPITFLTVFFIVLGLDLWDNPKVLIFGLAMFYCYFGTNMADQARQLLALSIVIIAFFFFYRHNYLYFVILTLFAMTFHTTALFSFALLLFNKAKYTKKDGIIVFFFLIFLSFILYSKIDAFINIIPGTSKYTYLITMLLEKQGVGIRLFFDTMPFIIAIFLLNIHNNFNQWGLKRIGYFTFPFRIGAYRTYFILRIMYYPAIFSIVTIANQMTDKSIKNLKIKRIIILTLFILYYFMDSFYFNTHGIMNYQLMRY